MGEKTPTDELRDEHEHARAAMAGLQRKIDVLCAGTDTAWPEVAGDLRNDLDELCRGLLLHFRKEEEGLFPEILRIVSKGAPRVDILGEFFGGEADDDLKAHHLLRSRLRQLRELLDAADKADGLDSETSGRLRGLTGATRDLLERHADKEHKLVFPMIERLLDPRQMAAAGERMRALQTECG